MAPRNVIMKGIRTALIVGTLLTLINQWHALFGPATFRWPAFFLTYLVPFTVFIYSYRSNRHERTAPTIIQDDKPADREH